MRLCMCMFMCMCMRLRLPLCVCLHAQPPSPRPPPPPTVCASAYVVAQGGDVQWSSREKEIGDGFDVDEVVAVVQALS